MLKRIQIKNFRSCKDVVLDDLGSVTALVGRNGSGKTNILRAIEWLSQAASSTELPTGSFILLWDQNTSAVVDVKLGETLYRYTLEGRETPSEKDGSEACLQESLAIQGSSEGWKTIIERQGAHVRVSGRPEPIGLGLTTPCLPALAALLPEHEEIHRYLRPILAFFRSTRYYPFDEASQVTGFDNAFLISEAEYREWATQYRATGKAQDSVLMRLLYAFQERPSQFEEIQSLLGSEGLGLIADIIVKRVYTVVEHQQPTPPSRRQYEYSVCFRLGQLLGGGIAQLYFPDLSLGTRRTLRLVVSLVLEGSALMLVEHPEDGIHRGLVRKLVNLLRTNADPAQIILSSHSTTVMNGLEAPNVRLVSILRGTTQVRALTSKEISLAARFIEEDGTLGDFLESVEG